MLAQFYLVEGTICIWGAKTISVIATAPAATAHMVKAVFEYVVRIYCFNGGK